MPLLCPVSAVSFRAFLLLPPSTSGDFPQFESHRDRGVYTKNSPRWWRSQPHRALRVWSPEVRRDLFESVKPTFSPWEVPGGEGCPMGASEAWRNCSACTALLLVFRNSVSRMPPHSWQSLGAIPLQASQQPPHTNANPDSLLDCSTAEPVCWLS